MSCIKIRRKLSQKALRKADALVNMHQHERAFFSSYTTTVCVNCRGLIGINLGCDLWGKLDLHYFLTRIKWRPCGYMNSLLGCNRWAWMCSLGKLSVTSVSSKFWWSQPINRGWGEVGVGRPVHSPQPKPRQKCLCLEMGSGWPAAQRLALHCHHSKWGMWLTSYLYTTVRIIWFFLIWPEEMVLSCSWYHISVQSLWECLLLSPLWQADGGAVCQLLWLIYMSQSRWTLRQYRETFP